LSAGLRAEVCLPTLPAVKFMARLDWIDSIPSLILWFAPNELYNAVQLELLAAEGSLAAVAFGTTAFCEILTEDRRDVLQIPIRAACRHGLQAEVLLAGPSGLQCRQVVTGATSAARVEILQGVTEGETVLTDHQSELRCIANSLP